MQKQVPFLFVSKHLPNGRNLFFPIFTLAAWRMRQTWGLLSLIGFSMLASVVLICTIPLYTQVASSAGLQSVFKATPQQAYVILNAQAHPDASSQTLHTTEQAFDRMLKKQLNTGLSFPSQFMVRTSFLLNPTEGQQLPGNEKFIPMDASHYQPMDSDHFTYVVDSKSYLPAQMASHLTHLQGRLPVARDDGIEILLTTNGAHWLNAPVGTTLSVPLSFTRQGVPPVPGTPLPQTLKLYVVGLFDVASTDDVFWHGEDFKTRFATGAPKDIVKVQAIVSTEGLMSVYDTLLIRAAQNKASYDNKRMLSWFYGLNIAQLDANHIEDLTQELGQVSANITNNTEYIRYLSQLSVFDPATLITSYQDRIIAARLPVALLALLMLTLILFFVNVMVDMLIERQSGVVAILRSRGASQAHIVGAFVVQSLLLGLIVLLAGPLLAPALTSWLVHLTLLPADQGVIHLVTDNIIQSAFGLRWFALVTTVTVIGAMLLGMYRLRKLDILASRRESGRSTWRVFRQLPWDIVLLVIASLLYGISRYIESTGSLDPHLQVQFLSPLILVAAICILLSGAFVVLRFLPLFLSWGAGLAARRRSAAPMLALVQVARAPRRVQMLMILLMLSVAFSVFSVVFSASQAQRIPSLVTYQAGADFSGTLAHIDLAGQSSLLFDRQVMPYRQIPGVRSATAGYVTTQTFSGNDSFTSVNVQAVDSTTFAQSTLWLEQDAASALALMRQLRAGLGKTTPDNAVPAIVDSATWDQLHLSPGQRFTLSETNGSLPYVALARVLYIPGNSGGILVDYQSYASAYERHFQGMNVPLTTIWLRTEDSPAAVATVRSALSSGDLRLDPLYDRRDMMMHLSNDPLYLTLAGALLAGAAIPLLLALVGNLLASWLNIRARLINFALLRALGGTPGQLTAVLVWEQALVYIVALGIGVLAGLLLSWLALPALVFTAVSSSGFGSQVSSSTFFELQQNPAVQIVFPPVLIGVPGIVIVPGVLALIVMVYAMQRLAIGRALRLNED